MVSSRRRCLRAIACGRRETTGAALSGRIVSCGTLAATIKSTSVTDDAQHQLHNDEQDDCEFKQLGSRCLRLTIEHGIRRPDDFTLALDTSARRRSAT